MRNFCAANKKVISYKKISDKPILGLLSIFLFLTLFNSSNVGIISNIGNFALYALIIYLCFNIIVNISSFKFNVLYFVFFAYIILCLIRSLILFSGFSLVVQLFTVLLIAMYCSNHSKEFIIDVVFNALALSIPFCIIDTILYRINGVSQIYGNSNMIGMICFVFTVSCLIHRWGNQRNKIIAVIFGILLILLSGTRTALLTVFIGLICFLILRHRSNKFVNLFFAVFMLAIVIGIYLYVFANEMPFMQGLNEFVYNLTHKNLFSGRNRIWKNILINFDINNLFLGYGLGYDVSGLSGENMSAHNQFIQILVQQGFIGLFFFVAILYYFYVKAYKKNDAVCSCIVIMIIIYNTFEVCLIQNHFSIGILFWFIMVANIIKNKTGKINELKR